MMARRPRNPHPRPVAAARSGRRAAHGRPRSPAPSGVARSLCWSQH